MDSIIQQYTTDEYILRKFNIDEIFIQKTNDKFCGGSLNNFYNIKNIINVFNFYDVECSCEMFLENNKRKYKHELFFKLKNKKIKNKNFNLIKNTLTNNLLYKQNKFYYYLYNVYIEGDVEYFTIKCIIDEGEIFLNDDILRW